MNLSITYCTRLFVAIAAIFVAYGGSVSVAHSDQPWGALGLSNVTPMSDTLGGTIRGTSASTSSSGLSFISAMLFDPATGSNMQSMSASKTGSSNMSIGGAANSQHEQIAQLGFGLQIQSSFGNFNGSVLGISGGLGLATSRP